MACFITASLALLLGACEKPAKEESRNPDGAEAKENTQSFATLPLLWQEKGAIEEATEDLMALHVAMQRYLEANGDIWPRAPQLVMDEVVKEHPDHDAHLVEPNADSLAAYRKFWEDTLKPFGATAQHWQNSHPDLFNPPFYKANRFTREKGAAYGKNHGNKALRWRFSEVVWFTIEYGVGPEKIFITASGRVKNTDTSADHLIKLPTDSRPQSLTQTAGNLIKVNIRHNGAMVVMGQQVTEEGLTKWINERFEKNPDLKVLIRCDKESKHLDLANVMSICRHVGVPQANIAIRTEK